MPLKLVSIQWSMYISCLHGTFFVLFFSSARKGLQHYKCTIIDTHDHKYLSHRNISNDKIKSFVRKSCILHLYKYIQQNIITATMIKIYKTSKQYSHIDLYTYVGLVYDVERHFQQYFNYIVAVSFIGGGISQLPVILKVFSLLTIWLNVLLLRTYL